MQHAYIVDQHVDLAAGFFERVDGGIDRCRIRQINMDGFDIPAGAGKRFGGFLPGAEVTRAGQGRNVQARQAGARLQDRCRDLRLSRVPSVL